MLWKMHDAGGVALCTTFNGMSGNGLGETKIAAFAVNTDNYNEDKMSLVFDGSDGIYKSVLVKNYDAFRTYELRYNTSKFTSLELLF